MRGINPGQLKDFVIIPVLTHLALPSLKEAAQLLMNTAEIESVRHYLHQIGGGPALGIYQMEPATHDDIFTHFLDARPELRARVLSLSIGGEPDSGQMVGNLYYATAMARIHYWRVPEPIPALNDIPAQAAYWKTHYNTHLGAGSEDKFIARAMPESSPGEFPDIEPDRSVLIS
jgi:hypothetical protein